MEMGLRYLVVSMSILLVISFSAMADKDKDRQECTNQLVGLATCVPYVGGNAKAPTPDCCSGLKQVLKDDKKCLCVIIRDRNDPDLGLNINVTLALGLPSVCHAPANVSQCPALLHLDPDSPEAQVFYQFAKGSTHGASAPGHAPAPSPTGGEKSVSATAGSTGATSDSYCNGKRWLGLKLEIISGGVLLLHFFSSYHFI